ncbi:MAG: hypothetical protein WC876_03705 [Candidatus Thermoplasmatota archaeon]
MRISNARRGRSDAWLFKAKPIACDGGPLKDYVIKLFKNEMGGYEVLSFSSDAQLRLKDADHRQPALLLQMSGEGCSMHAAEFVAGPGGEILTFADIVQTDPQKAVTIFGKIRKALKPLFQAANPNERGLARLYLSNPGRHLDTLQAELRTLGWPGVSNAANPLDAVIEWLAIISCKATKFSKSHGDLHGENIVIHDDDGVLKPVLIDFASVGDTHAAADLVALAADTLTKAVVAKNGLAGIAAAANAMLGVTAPASHLEQVLSDIGTTAVEELDCSPFEFAGGVLSRALWVLPRTKPGVERDAFRRLIIEMKAYLERAATSAESTTPAALP